jgi:hypothetical protein
VWSLADHLLQRGALLYPKAGLFELNKKLNETLTFCASSKGISWRMLRRLDVVSRSQETNFFLK